MDSVQIKEMVRARYGGIAAAAGAVDCCAAATSCCGDVAPGASADKSRQMGYSDAELAAVPDGANLGLGCGNPEAIAALKPGEVVVDLGSGAGFDCFLAAGQVGAAGRVIGIDMTHEMLKKARENAAKISAANVEFRLGELEHLPVADNTADAILSNCVINLVPDKAQVFREAFRVLKPGGRLAISDVVNTAPLSPELRADPALLCGCIAGAAPVERIETWLTQAGFTDVRVTPKPESRELIATWAPGRGIENFVASAMIEARKPAGDRPAVNERPYNVLFLCTGNSARSILAEVLIEHWGKERFKGYSAGSFPKSAVHPLALELLEKLHLPTRGLRSKSWNEFARPGAPVMDFVFTVCDQAAGEVCPVWPGNPVTAHWGVPDPAAAEGEEPAQRRAFRDAYFALENRIKLFVALPIEKLDRMAIKRNVDEIGRRRAAPRLELS